jgi:hypothetical protein
VIVTDDSDPEDLMKDSAYRLRIGSFNAVRKEGKGEGGTLGTIRTPHPVIYMAPPHKYTPSPYSSYSFYTPKFCHG